MLVENGSSNYCYFTVDPLLPTTPPTPDTEPAPTDQPSPTTPPTTLPTSPNITVSITVTGNNTAGKNYSLECSATVTGSTDQPTIIWLHDGDEIYLTETTRMMSPPSLRSSSDYSSTLTFNPLLTSHAGTYTCTAMVGSVVETAAVVVTVQSEYSLQVRMVV